MLCVMLCAVGSDVEEVKLNNPNHPENSKYRHENKGCDNMLPNGDHRSDQHGLEENKTERYQLAVLPGKVEQVMFREKKNNTHFC